jgi:hypothetical protein
MPRVVGVCAVVDPDCIFARVCCADAASGDAYEQLVGAWLRDWNLLEA